MLFEPMEEHQRCNELVISTKTEKQSLISYDIVDFHTSISDELLNKSIEWARKHTLSGNSEYKTIMHSRRILLYDYKGNMWSKK